MKIMTTAHQAPRSRGLTRADLEHAPDDGQRYEIVDGAIFVSPAPRYRHQRCQLLLSLILHRRTPPDMVVLTAPFAVGLAEDTEVQPDLIVAPPSDFSEVDLPTAPLLAVEILSPSTRHVDLDIKRRRYEQAGIASYWILNPDGPTLTALELRDGAYVEAAVVGPDDTWEATSPFPVTIRPADLVD